jgi:type II secretory pathway component GspD/PulD (secretin)
MNISLHRSLAIAVVAAFGLAPLGTNAASESDGANTVPLSTMIAAVAKRSGKKFIVDPRVQGDAMLFQENPASLSYEGLLMVLNVHGFAAVTTGDYVRVVPDASVRSLALPLADGDKHPLGEYVTRIIRPKSVPASHLVPLLRPLIPQQGHMVAMPCTNDVIIVDTFGNIQRLEQIIKSLDRGEPFTPPKCEHGPIMPPARKDGDK